MDRFDGRVAVVTGGAQGMGRAVAERLVGEGASVVIGDLDGRLAICPWHGWRWDVTTGANANNPAVKIACFPTRVENGDVYVELP